MKPWLSHILYLPSYTFTSGWKYSRKIFIPFQQQPYVIVALLHRRGHSWTYMAVHWVLQVDVNLRDSTRSPMCVSSRQSPKGTFLLPNVTSSTASQVDIQFLQVDHNFIQQFPKQTHNTSLPEVTQGIFSAITLTLDSVIPCHPESGAQVGCSSGAMLTPESVSFLCFM